MIASIISGSIHSDTSEGLMTQDSDLQQLVLAELSWEPSLMAGHIGVIAADGVITLSGSVENFAAKHAAETAALQILDALGTG